MSKKVFISYSHENKVAARQLSDVLKSWGYDVWLDEECIKPGDLWPKAITEGLNESDYVLALMTPAACESHWVQDEWYYAYTMRKPIVPMKYEEPINLPHFMVVLQYIDFKADANRNFAQLKQALGHIPVEPPPPPPPPSPILKPAPDSNLVDLEPLPIKPTFDHTNRGQMLQKVYEYWIEGVLDKSLRDNPLIDLGIEGRPQAILRHIDYGDYVLPSSMGIDQIFNDVHPKLLILGAPGSGKTFTTLQLLRHLILTANKDAQRPIPVMFNLSSWVEKRSSIADWLVHELQTKYQVPQKVANDWIANIQLVTILDGLDEVRKENRDECVTKINEFRNTYRSIHMVVCSRIFDYESLSERLDLAGAVLLQPLSTEQIQHAVQSEKLVGLRDLVKTDPDVAEMAQSPFLLNTMRFAYEGMTRIPRFDSAEERRDHLFDEYVEKKIRRVPSEKYLLNPTRHYLAWLATNMVKQSQSVFHIEALEPDWLDKLELQRTYNIRLRIYRSVVGAIISALPFAIGGGIAYGLSFGILCGVILGLLGAVISPFSQRMVVGLKLQSSFIEPVEVIKWSWTAMLRTVLKHIAITLAFGVAMAVGFGLVASLILGKDLGLARGLTAGFAYGLAVGLVGWVSDGFVTGQVLTKTQPNEGIFRSIRNALYVAPIYGVAGAVGGAIGFILAGLLMGTVDNGFIGGAIGGYIGGVMIGLMDKGAEVAIQHGILRQILYQSGYTPINYSDFLDYAADRDILRKVGGGYTFLHRLLLEYFAEIETD